MALWAGVALVLVGWADATVHNVSETLFLKRVGVEWLPTAFLASSLLLVASTAWVGRRMGAADRVRALSVVYAIGAVVIALLASAIVLGIPGAFTATLFASKQIRAVGLLVMWLALGDLLNAQQAKRVFAPVTAGFTLGAIGGSFTSGPLGAMVGPEPLVWLSSCLILAAGAVTLQLGARRRARLERGFRSAVRAVGPEQAAARAAPSAAPVVRLLEIAAESRLFRLLAVSAVCSGLLGPILYFQFSYVADAATSGSQAEQSLLSLYARFWGWTNVIVLVTQLVLSGRLYRWIGIPAALAISPLTYLLGLGGLATRLALPTGIGAMGLTRLADHAVYDPAMPVIYNLFPERMRPRATSLLEGPIKRSAAALGNVVVMTLLAVGAGAAVVAYFALPIALLWSAAALILWRRYPQILLSSSSAWSARVGRGEITELLDRSTVRTLGAVAARADDDARDAAIEIVRDAEPAAAIEVLAALSASGSTHGRAAAVAALSAVLHRVVECPVAAPDTLEHLVDAIRWGRAAAGGLPERERVELVQAYDRLAPLDDRKRAVLRECLADESPAVRLAAGAARDRADGAHDDIELARALAGDDAACAQAAVDELRRSLLCAERGADEAAWTSDLASLAAATESPSARPYAARSLVDVARAHGARAAAAADAVLALRSDPDAEVRAAALSFVGHAGLSDHASCLAQALTDGTESELAAAREGLLALGCAAVEPLLDQYWFGRRRARNEILDIVAELDAEPERLEGILEQELDTAAHNILISRALEERTEVVLLRSRLAERTQQGLHTVLLLLAALEDRPQVAEVAALLRRAHDAGERSILLEALDSLLSVEEKEQLLPLIDGRGAAAATTWAAQRLGSRPLEPEAAAAAVLEDADPLTRDLARAELARADVPVEESEMLEHVDIAVVLGSVPLFDRLTTRQLMELAALARYETYGPDRTLVSEGEPGSSMYVIVQGRVRVRAHGRTLRTLSEREFFGELALIDDEVRSATVTAETDLRLLRLERADFLALLEENPSVAIEFSRALARRLRETNELE